MTTPEDTRVAKLEAELDDFRRAWAILDEPRENLRHAHTATEAATQFRAKLAAARQDIERVSRLCFERTAERNAAIKRAEVAEAKVADLDSEARSILHERSNDIDALEMVGESAKLFARERDAALAREAALREALQKLVDRFFLGHGQREVDGCNDCDEALKPRSLLATTPPERKP